MSELHTAPIEQAAGTRRLTVLYITALSAIALLTIAGQVSVQWSLAQQRRSSTVINIAGRQRMMSQKLTKTALLLADADPAAWERLAADLEATTKAWKRAHRGLQFGDAELDLSGRNSVAVQELFRELTPHYEAMLAGKELVAAGEAQAGLAKLLQHETIFLDKMDAIVDQYDREAQADIAWLTWEEGLLLATTLCVLLVEGFFIFRPAVARIRLTVDALSRAKLAAEEANAEKSRFLARMSHELRTPLNVILGLIDVQLALARPAVNGREYVLTMRDAAEGLLRLVDDLLEIGQWEAGSQLRIRLSPVPLAEVVARTVQMFEQSAHQKNLRLTFHCDDGIPAFLNTDAGRIQQLAINLINNAIKFTDVDGVDVYLHWNFIHDDIGEATLVVKDTGIGISAADHERIFESFVQLTHADRRRQPGVGLGLNIVARLVDALQGSITVNSSPGEGSTFEVRLPMTVGWVGNVPTEAPENVAMPRHVLVIEDATENQLVCKELLRSLGHTCHVASTAAEGLCRAKANPYDAVLLDIELPDASGLDIVKQLRALPGYDGMLIAAVSAHALVAHREAALAAGFTQFVSKPVRSDDLRQLLGDASKESSSSPAVTLAGTDRWKDRPELFHRLIRLYRTEWPQLLENLAQAISAKDARKAHFFAHRIRGLTLNFDDRATIEAAQQLEDLAQRQDFAGASAVYGELATSLQRLESHLTALADQPIDGRSWAT